MQFALNYSPEAVALHTGGDIEIDLYKMPDWENLAREFHTQARTYVHFGITVGSPITIDWNFVDWALEHTETRYVNVHLAVWRDVMPDTDILDLSPVVIGKVRELMRGALLEVVARYGAENVIAENVFALDRAGGEPMLACTLPDVITGLIEEAGCGLLLDLPHARMAAFTHGLDVRDYINRLPLSRLRELHVTGIGFRDDGRLGDHLPMRDDDWALYAWAIDLIYHNPRWRTPEIVASEYGGVGERFRKFSRADVLAAEVPRMVAALCPP